MVARSASQPGGFSPTEQPRVAVAGDGTLAAIHEASRVTILEVPSGAAFAEIGVDPEALASEVAWVGTPPRMLVLARYATHSTVHLLDPYGPRSIAEIRLESPMRLFASVGAAALVVGSHSSAVLAASEAHLMRYQFPSRNIPVAAGAAAGLFVVALTGSIEEWDPQSRMPKRRLRLLRAAAITAVGGSERMVWMTTQLEPARIDVIPMVNRGQPRAHELSEPIASIAGHPRSDLVACIGAETGRVYVVDLDGRHRLRILPPDGDGRFESAALVLGRMTGVLAAQAGRAVMIAPLDGRDEADPVARSALATPVAAEPAGAAPAEARAPAPAEPVAAGADDEPAPSPGAPADRGDARRPLVALDLSAAGSRPVPSASARFSAWRDLVRQSQSSDEPVARDAPPACACRACRVRSGRSCGSGRACACRVRPGRWGGDCGSRCADGPGGACCALRARCSGWPRGRGAR
jgi:hypothetical protein